MVAVVVVETLDTPQRKKTTTYNDGPGGDYSYRDSLSCKIRDLGDKFPIMEPSLFWSFL